jgi:hypothetical protein
MLDLVKSYNPKVDVLCEWPNEIFIEQETTGGY